MFEAAGVSHDALSIASNEAPASARRNALERTAEQHPNDNFQENIDSTALEGVDFPKLNEILGLDEKNLTAIAAVSLGYRSPKDGNAQRPKSRLTRDELFTSLD